MILRTPDRAGRWALAAALACWMGAAAGRAGWGLGAVPLVAAAALVSRRRPWILWLSLVLAAGAFSGWSSVGREIRAFDQALPDGSVTVAGRLLGDLTVTRRGDPLVRMAPTHLRVGSAWRPWAGPPLLVELAEEGALAAGEQVVVEGWLTDQDGRLRGDPFGGVVEGGEVVALRRPVITGLINRLRAQIVDRFADDGPAGGLMTGFLIGETAGLPEDDTEAMRGAGLSHFVAVSGSNVALFLGLVWLALGPVGMGRWRRPLAGLTALVVFVMITRWEPSVLRASVVAGAVLVTSGLGWPISGWTATGAAVTALVAVSGELVGDLGFQLSVAAALGIMVGGGGKGRWWRRITVATIAAQAAVAPILLFHFDTVPLAAPLANLLSAPMVAAATVIGGLGALAGMEPVADLGVILAAAVLTVGRSAAGLPQIGWTGLVVVMVLAGGWRRLPRARPHLALAVALVVAVRLVGPLGPPDGPVISFLDVGQGDAALLRGPGGEAILVDGGPDPGRVLEALRRRGVHRLQLVVVSHLHQDHVGGLPAVLSAIPTEAIWYPGVPTREGEGFAEVVEEAAAARIPMEVPAPGRAARIGVFSVEVLGPRRRYASPNDQSLVLLVEASGRRALFPGDIERIAQREIGPVPTDVLKVPHQGAATSDAEWLRGSAGTVAVISVGPNRFGHPADWVIEELEAAGSTVLRTDRSGDIDLELESVIPASALRSRP